MMQAYGHALRTPGALKFSIAGLLGRLPASMTALGIVLLVQHSTDSYGKAGIVSAVYVLTSAGTAPIQGRFADRFGQRPILLVSATVYALSVLGLIVAAGESFSSTIAAAMVSGATAPQVGNMVRTRWTHAVKDRQVLSTAFAWEAILDEVVFIIGPVLVTFLTLNVYAPLGLGLAGTSALVGGWGLALQGSTAPMPVKRSKENRDPLPMASLAPLIFAAVGVGFVFGGSEILIVAFTDELGQKTVAGWVLAASAVGSLLAGVVVGARNSVGNPISRLRLFTLLLALSLTPLFFATSILHVTIGMFIMGLTIAPTLITAVNVVELVTPLSRLTEALTWVTTGLSAGVASGAIVSGRVVEIYDASWGFAVMAGAAGFAAVVAWFAPVPQSLRSRKNA